MAALLSTPIVADELTGTPKKTKGAGTITLGHRNASIPFSYLDTEPDKPIGYSHDLQLRVVEAVKKELNLPDLEARCNLITSQTHIPLVQNGTVDIECDSTTNNEERRKQIDSSVGIFEVSTRLLSKRTANIRDFDDLEGKSAVTTAGTTSERLLKAVNADKKVSVNIISAKDHSESFMMLESGRTVAFVMDGTLLYGEMARAKKPDDWTVGGTPQSFKIYGCMVHKGDAAFKKMVDKAIIDTYASGGVNRIYDKQFTRPAPPKGLSLSFPVSEELKKLIASPTDKAVEQM